MQRPWIYTGLVVTLGASIFLSSFFYGKYQHLENRLNGNDFVKPTIASMAYTPTAEATASGKKNVYVVMPGDTLGKIAQQYNTTVGELASLNNIADPDRIGVGQELKIPYSTPIPYTERGTVVEPIQTLPPLPKGMPYPAGADANPERQQIPQLTPQNPTATATRTPTRTPTATYTPVPPTSPITPTLDRNPLGLEIVDLPAEFKAGKQLPVKIKRNKGKGVVCHLNILKKETGLGAGYGNYFGLPDDINAYGTYNPLIPESRRGLYYLELTCSEPPHSGDVARAWSGKNVSHAEADVLFR